MKRGAGDEYTEMRSIGGKIRWRGKEIKESDRGEGEREWVDGKI